MPTFTSHPVGSPCWVDLMSPDPDASQVFYSALFGWSAEPLADEEGNPQYTLFSKDGANVAGLGGQFEAMGDIPPVWTTYVATDDVQATTTRVEAAGGSVITPPMQAMEAGEMAVLADPTGAVFAVWKPNEHIGADLCNEPDTWSWNELLTRDIGAATAFYSAVFGWTLTAQEMGPTGIYHVIEGGEHGGWGGMMAMPPGMPDMVPNHWAVYFTVSDLDAMLAEVAELGGQTVSPPMPIPGVGTTATVHDPQGGSFVLLQPEG